MLSVVIPVFNEEAVIPELLRRFLAASGAWGSYELIFVNDGSGDATAALLEQATNTNKNIRVINFSRNFGHQAAVTAGLQHAQGDAVVVIDGDLQDPPEAIAPLIAKWRDGYQVVYAVRTQRKENMFKRAAYSIFYRMLRAMAKIDIPLDAGDFCLMDARVVRVMNALPERNRFVRGLRAWAGFASVGVPYEREQRFAGAPKYTFRKLLHLAFDGFTSFSAVPLKLAGYVGFAIALLSFIGGVVLILLKLAFGVAVQGWTSVMVSLFFMGGIQLTLIGVMGEYIGRIYTEVQGRPVYVIEKKIGFEK
jgi:dolichol-phosphate mannosyltransferase